jgi:VIT1/CCC1 family predicted Fe2+/Mn2+ transporter
MLGSLSTGKFLEGVEDIDYSSYRQAVEEFVADLRSKILKELS